MKSIKLYVVFIFLILIIGGIIVTADISGNSITGVLKEQEKLPQQIFEITFDIEDTIILSGDDLITKLTFESSTNIPTLVNITYIILDETGKRFHVEQESIIVEQEKFLEKGFQGINLDYGIYRIFVRTLYNENIENEFWKEFEIRKSLAKSLFQLFDIKFEIDNSLVSGTEELVARINFESFGAEPTPVKIEFIFLDADGKEIYIEETYEIVETEKIVVKKFGDLNFKNGEYSLVLKTLYNIDVQDEFVRKFEIKEKDYYLWGFWISIMVNLVLAISIFKITKKSYKLNKKYRKKKKAFIYR